MQMNLIRKGLKKLIQTLQFILWHTPVSIAALIGLYFTFALLVNPAEETISITNYAFAIVIALASISFGYASCLDTTEQKHKMQYCGERFLHSALLFLVASVIKYFLLQDQVRAFPHVLWGFGAVINFLSVFLIFLFLGSLVNSIAAFRELNAHLYSQKKPGQELIRFI
jgi:hypothetical protein